MRLTLHQLHVLSTVVECQSVTRAAQRLHMTQPAVSNILRQLQDYFGIPLLQKVQKQISLTHEGQLLIQTYSRFETELLNLQQYFEEVRTGKSGMLKISIVTTAKYFFPKILGEYKKLNQNINIDLHVDNRGAIIQRLEKNQDDFVIMSTPPKSGHFIKKIILTDELVVAQYRKKKPESKPIDINTLEDHIWLFRENSSGTQMASQTTFSKLNFYPPKYMSIRNNEAIKQMLIADLGISVISKLSIQPELDSGELAIIPTQGFPIQHPWYLVYSSKQRLTNTAEKFLEFLNENKDLDS